MKEEKIKMTRSIFVKMPVIENVEVNVNPLDGKTEIYGWTNGNGERYKSYRFVVGFIKDNEIISPFKIDNGDFYLYSRTDIDDTLFTTIDDAVASYGVELTDIVVYDIKNGDLWYVESDKSYSDVGLTKLTK